MRRIRKIFLGLVILSVGIVGCGKDKDKSTEDTSATATTHTATEATEYAPVETATPSEPAAKDEDGFVVREDHVKAIEDYVNVRTAPEVDAPIFRIVEKGTVLERTGDNAKWTRVNIDETSFYVYSEYVEVTQAPVKDVDGNSTASPSDATATDAVKREKKVVIDAANQANPNFDVEAVGPGSKTKKQCATAGNVGIALSTREYEINLKYAKALEEELKARGYEVILTRTSDSDDISNKKRAELANTSGASALIRIQMNYSKDTKISGVMAICMSKKSPYNASLYKQSYELSTRLLQGITSEVEATNRGIYETEGLTLINWSDIPVSVIKLGFLSNVHDEADLVSEEYQKKLIGGIADGLDYYFAD